MVIILTVLALLIYLYMLVHAYKCEGDIDCISDIAYDKHSKLFPICMITMAIIISIGMFIVTPASYAWTCIIPAIAIIIVALTPYKDNTIKYKIHFVSALISFVSIFILWGLHGEWYIPLICCLASLRKKWLLGIEMGTIASAIIYNLI